MKYSYSTRVGGIYRGWEYSVSTDLNNNYTIFISPPNKIPYHKATVSSKEIEVYDELIKLYDGSSYVFVYKDRFLKFFVAPLPNLSKGVTAAKEFIDSKLVDFNFE